MNYETAYARVPHLVGQSFNVKNGDFHFPRTFKILEVNQKGNTVIVENDTEKYSVTRIRIATLLAEGRLVGIA